MMSDFQQDLFKRNFRWPLITHYDNTDKISYKRITASGILFHFQYKYIGFNGRYKPDISQRIYTTTNTSVNWFMWQNKWQNTGPGII